VLSHPHGCPDGLHCLRFVALGFNLFRNSKFVLVISLLFSGSMWFYVQHVMIPHQIAEAAAVGSPRGNLSDLYPRWLGARELLLHHRDPYSPQVTEEIQAGYYGRPLDPKRPQDPRDKQAFAYPVYVVFLLAPVIHLQFSVVQAGFRWFLILLTAASVMLWFRILRWQVPVVVTASAIAITLGSFPVLQGIKLQQLTLLVSGLISFGALLLVQGYFAAAGIVLAFATIKPQLALPLSCWLCLWCLEKWHLRQRFIWAYAGAMIVLCSASEVVLPGWTGKFLAAMSDYMRYTGGAGSVLDVLLTPRWGRALSVAIIGLLAVMAWRLRRVNHDSPVFRFMLVLLLVATTNIMPKTAAYNQILLMPAVMLLVRQAKVLWPNSWASRSILMICSGILLWPWIAAVSLLCARLFVPAQVIQRAWAQPLYTTFTIPLAAIVLLTFYFRKLSNPEIYADESALSLHSLPVPR